MGDANAGGPYKDLATGITAGASLLTQKLYDQIPEGTMVVIR